MMEYMKNKVLIYCGAKAKESESETPFTTTGQSGKETSSGESSDDVNKADNNNKNPVLLSLQKKKKVKSPGHYSLYSSDSEGDSEDELKRRIQLTRSQNYNCGRNYSCSTNQRPIYVFLKKLDTALATWSVRTLDRLRKQEKVGQVLVQDKMTRGFINGKNITFVALASRLILFILQLIMTNLYSFTKHTNDGFKFIPERGYGSELDNAVNATFGGLANWDGQYFLHIAVHGYTEEKMMAFFPLFPMIVSSFAIPIHFFLGGFMSLSSTVLICGIFVNTFCFVKTAHVIYEIARHVEADKQENKLGSAAVMLFCFNPASVFFSSFYTEGLFAFLTAKSILSAYKGEVFLSTVWAGLSAACRSNGLLNFGFIISFVLHEAVIYNGLKLSYIILDLFGPALMTFLSLAPFFVFQIFGILTFCEDQEQVPKYRLKHLPPYCTYKTFPYAYVQQKYWNVGFLRYFEVKQLPNFLLALPVLYFVISESWKRLRVLAAKAIALRSPRNIFKIYIAFHGLFLAIFCFLNIHVQVSTRLILAAFPHFYIYLAESCCDETSLFRQRTIPWPIRSSCVQFWFGLYFILGGIAFPLGYPWT